MEKTCKVCARTLAIDEFYRNTKGTARQSKCKECARAAVRKNRKEKLDYYRAYDRDRGKLPHRKALCSRMGKRWRGSANGYDWQRKQRAKYPTKYKARNALSNAIRDGRIERKPCGGCGSPCSCAQRRLSQAASGALVMYSMPWCRARGQERAMAPSNGRFDPSLCDGARTEADR
jgi:hypothetical protein